MRNSIINLLFTFSLLSVFQLISLRIDLKCNIKDYNYQKVCGHSKLKYFVISNRSSNLLMMNGSTLILSSVGSVVEGQNGKTKNTSEYGKEIGKTEIPVKMVRKKTEYQ